MAKKSVGLVEQHIEKAVLGLAALYLLAVVFLYLISKPNTVEIDGKTVYPAQVDRIALERATALVQSLRRPQADPGDSIEPPEWEAELDAQFEPPRQGPAENLLTAAVPPGLPFEELEFERVERVREGVALADVIPPGEPTAEYQRVLAQPPKEPRPPAEATAPRQPQAEEVLEEDIDLVVLHSSFDLARQQDVLKEQGYAEEFGEVTIASVEVMRQERIGLGPEYTDWEPVTPYREIAIPEPPKLRLVGENALSREGYAEFVEYADQIRSETVQRELLLPLGPTRRTGAPAYQPGEAAGAPSPPVARAVRQTGERRSEALRRAREARRNARTDSSRRTARPDAEEKTETEYDFRDADEAEAFIDDHLAKAEQALKDGQREEAQEFARKALEAHQVSRAASREEEQRLREILGLAEGAEIAPGPAGQPLLQKIRVFDVTAEPGRTYRYAIRVGILNEYCRAAGKIEDPNDATKPVLYGEWSVPSEPVSVDRDTYFYLVGKDTRTESLRVEVFKWYQGGWIRQTFTVQPGFEIGDVRGVQVKIGENTWREEVDFFTGSMAVDMQLEAPYQSLQAQSSGGYALSDWGRPTSESLVYMDEDGELHRRYAASDKDDPRYRDLLERTRGPREKTIKVDKGAKRDDKKVKRGRSSRKRGYGSRGRSSRSRRR